MEPYRVIAMSDLMIIGVLVLVGCMMVARMQSQKALKSLSEDEKRRLLETFAPMRMYHLIPSIALLALFLFLQYRGEDMHLMWIWLVLAIAVLSQIASAWLMSRKLRDLALPSSYTRRVMAAHWLSFTGFVILIVLFLVDVG